MALIPTWTFDAVTQVGAEVVNDIQQELKVVDIVHVNFVRVGGDGPQLVLVCVFHT